MEKVALKSIIKDLVFEYDFANPIDDNFNEILFEQELRKIEISIGKENIEGEEEGKQCIDAVIRINQIVQGVKVRIEELVLEVNLPEQILIEQILALSNFSVINALKDIDASAKDTKTLGEIVNVSQYGQVELNTLFGSKILANDAIDVSTDIAIRLIGIVATLRFEDDSTIDVVGKEQIAQIQELLIATNLLINIESAIHFYRYEFAELRSNDKSITVKHVPSFYHFIKVAGRDRENSHIHEIMMRFYGDDEYMQPSKSPGVSVRNGEITLSIGESKINRHIIGLESTVNNYFNHLENIVFPTFKELRIEGLTKFLAELKYIFNELPTQEILSYTTETQDRALIPIKVDRDKLVRFLAKRSDLSVSATDRLVTLLSDSLSSNINFWKTPFLRIKGSLYFLIAPLSNGHASYLIDNILSKCYKGDRRQTLFFASFKKYVGKIKVKDYLFEVVDIGKVDSILTKFNDEIFLVRLKTTLLFIAPSSFTYPLDSIEYHEAFQILEKKSQVIKDAILKIKQNTSLLKGWTIEDCIGIIVANYPALTSLNLNGVTVFDSQLFGNYFIVGKFTKGMLISGQGTLNQKSIASIKYYNNEDEFNKSIRGFALRPLPLEETFRSCSLREYPITFPGAEPVILSDGIERLSLKESIEIEISEVKSHLQQLYYFEDDLGIDRKEDKQIIGDTLNFLIPKVTNFISLNRTDPTFRLDLLKAFREGSGHGLAYLFFSLQKYIVEVPIIKFSTAQVRPEIEFDDEAGEKLLYEIFEKNFDKSKKSEEINLFEYDIKHDLSGKELANVLGHIRNLLAATIPRSYTEEQLDHLYFTVALYSNFSNGVDSERKNLYSILGNFVDILNHNGYYQKARNFAETVIHFAFKNETSPLIGWQVAFKCYTKQSNVLDAAFYGNLYFSALTSSPTVYVDQVFDSLFNAMLFFRDYRFLEITDTIFIVLQGMKKDNYDSQKVFLSYHCSKLFNPKKLNDTLPEIFQFLSENLKSIIDYGQQAVLPWIAFIYNIRNIQSKTNLEITVNFDEILKKLEEKVDEKTLIQLKTQFFLQGNQTKDVFRSSMAKVFETKYFEDFASELGSLEAIAKNNALVSMDPLDVNSLLLSGIVLNDSRLTFQSSTSDKRTEPFAGDASGAYSKILSTYGTSIIERLNIKKGQLICWLFNIYSKVYLLIIDESKQSTIKRIDTWDIGKMVDWTSGIAKFYFDGKGDFPIDQQETKYLDLVKELKFANLGITQDFDELLIAQDLDLASFPHGLVVNNIEGSSSYHTEFFRQSISKTEVDFVSFHKPVANILSLEWYANLEAATLIDLSLEAWIPVEDDDFVLNMAYEKLKPLIEGKLNGKIQTSLYPKKQMSSTLNIFMAHGSRGIEGFRTIYTKSQEGHAIVKEGGIQYLMGKGVIAILFVCNSASISKEVYSQKLISLIHEIFRLGYQAVAAPAWSLNPDITPIWLESFMESVSSGDTVNKAVYFANNKVAKYGYNEHHGFFYPAGWASMHLYGNPNVRFG